MNWETEESIVRISKLVEWQALKPYTSLKGDWRSCNRAMSRRFQELTEELWPQETSDA